MMQILTRAHQIYACVHASASTSQRGSRSLLINCCHHYLLPVRWMICFASLLLSHEAIGGIETQSFDVFLRKGDALSSPANFTLLLAS
jgi:hypothetical protein